MFVVGLGDSWFLAFFWPIAASVQRDPAQNHAESVIILSVQSRPSVASERDECVKHDTMSSTWIAISLLDFHI